MLRFTNFKYFLRNK